VFVIRDPGQRTRATGREKSPMILYEMDAFNIATCYPDTLTSLPSQSEANEYLRCATEVYHLTVSVGGMT